MNARLRGALSALVFAGLLAGAGATAASLPAGFQEALVASPRSNGSWSQAVGLTFSTTGRMFVWERGGRVWIVDSTTPVPQPFLDLNEEVLGWGDHGMLGFALHPDFNSTGYVYAMYTVDRNHLVNCDSPRDGAPSCGAGYVAANTWLPTDLASPGYLKATIARIVRYRAVLPAGDADYRNATTVDYASRRVLLGDTMRSLPKSGGIPLTYDSHGHGSLVFGQDGTLLASTGDNASYATTDGGSAAETYYSSAVADGIMRTAENVGAFRAQMVDSLAGKVLRLDPETGDGLPGNPFFSAPEPRSARSRIWALGLRNPYRMTLRPGTGDHNPAAANPGSLYLGDVGLSNWEEMNVIRQGGNNYGWPLFEGMGANANYSALTTRNPDALNPLANPPTCPATIRFRDLIAQEVAGVPSFPNPCNSGVQLPPAVTVFEHARPELEWRHTTAATNWAAFTAAGLADTWPVGTTNAGRTVTGTQFAGNAAIGGIWYQGTSFPAQYRNTYFAADYGTSWIRSFMFDGQDRLLGVNTFATNVGEVVALGAYPPEGNLYYVTFDSRVRRISYTPNEPVALVAATPVYGPSPLQVSFVGAASYDPQGLPLTYLWDFADGTTSTAQNPLKTYTVGNGQVQNFVTSLTVTDATALTSQAFVSISVNNTPPTVRITAPADGGLYSVQEPTQVSLTSQISDQQTPANLLCSWQVIMHHNNHTHTSPALTACNTTASLSTVGCDGETYYYVAELTVTDPQGLSTIRSVRLDPACTGSPTDSYAPGTPAGLTGTAAGSGAIDLSWTASADTGGSGLAGYRVYRNADAAPLATVLASSWRNSGLSPSTAYSYRVTAFDNAGNESAQSAAVLVTTSPATGDADGDGIADASDNCTLVANPTQCDSDGDGYGNHCDGDLNNNGSVNAQDITLFRQQLGQPSIGPAFNAADVNCSGAVNAQDTSLFRPLQGTTPGPSGLHP